MVCRHRQQHRVTPLRSGLKGCQRQGRGSVAPSRFQQDPRASDAGFLQLTGRKEAMLRVAHQHRLLGHRDVGKTVQTQRSVLQHGACTCQRQELLWIGFSGQWPQAGAGAAAQHDGQQNVLGVSHGLAQVRVSFCLRVGSGRSLQVCFQQGDPLVQPAHVSLNAGVQHVAVQCLYQQHHGYQQ